MVRDREGTLMPGKGKFDLEQIQKSPDRYLLCLDEISSGPNRLSHPVRETTNLLIRLFCKCVFLLHKHKIQYFKHVNQTQSP